MTHHVNNIVLRYALHTAIFDLRRRGGRIPGRPIIDSLFVLLKLVLELSADEQYEDARWIIVCVYLWTSWQRCLMLYLWTQMAVQLDGYDYEENDALYLKGLQDIPLIYQVLNRQHLERLHRTTYLCSWSFRSLQTDRANISLDFRHFHDLYHGCFGQRRPICNPGPTQCTGSSSQDCKRYKNSEVKNQSVHDLICKGTCQRLFWSRDSFIAVRGTRAVDIACTDNYTLRYRKLTKSTLAISHVWSHGQGGRPDNVGPEGTGFNLCLHRRYADLAVQLGCDSYWMDTPCIPSEKKLRWECIKQINSVFAMSAKTLICDRDIMTIDVSDTTTNAYESILATLLVCDWAVRAWTLLEAMRGRSYLFVLCLHNRVISLTELLRTVHATGRIDIATLFLGRDYIFPPMAVGDFELFPGRIITSELEREIEDGFLSISEAAALLSHRHPTRDGDDLLIWSLLIGDLEDKSPVEMWARQIGKHITTGSLISSAPRVQCVPGFGWAPYLPTPVVHVQEPNKFPKAYPAYDGNETSKGQITKEGLRAKWLISYFVDPTSFWFSQRDTQTSGPTRLCTEIFDQYLRGFKWGALLQAAPRSGPRKIPARYRGVLGHVVVVCGSHNNVSWEWRGIYEWDADVLLPSFTFEDILLV